MKSASARRRRVPSKNTQPAPDGGVTGRRVGWSPVRSPGATRSIATLLGLCVLAGVLVAGMTFPVAAGVGLVASDAGDSVQAVSTDLLDGPLPQTTVVTD